MLLWSCQFAKLCICTIFHCSKLLPYSQATTQLFTSLSLQVFFGNLPVACMQVCKIHNQIKWLITTGPQHVNIQRAIEAWHCQIDFWTLIISGSKAHTAVPPAKCMQVQPASANHNHAPITTLRLFPRSLQCMQLSIKAVCKVVIAQYYS